MFDIISSLSLNKIFLSNLSAELFPQSSEIHHTKASDVKDDDTWNEVVVSFKHLHVRRPGFKKHRRAKKHHEKGKGLANLLNLAIAAGNLQKPIVWPARLNCDCKRLNASLLNPSKLRVSSDSAAGMLKNLPESQSKSLALGGTCCLCKDKYSKEYATIKRQQLPNALFGHNSNVSCLTFNSLCHEQISAERKNACQIKQAGAAGLKDNIVCTSSNSSSDRQQRQMFSGQQLFTNNPLKPLSSSELLCSSPVPTQYMSAASPGPPAIYAKPSTITSLTTAVPSGLNSASSTRPLTHSLPSVSSHHTGSAAGVGRSCSQEVRDMEDTNVNELASYLEDLLHIPRKMSTMAEMMYA